MKLTLPKISCYVRYQSGNYGINALRLDVGPLTVWFSYKTPVAFHAPGCPRVVRHNAWGPTTGRHLKAIDGGRGERVDDETFERLWARHVEPLLADDDAPAGAARPPAPPGPEDVRRRLRNFFG